MFDTTQLWPVLPEIFLFGWVLLMLLVGAFASKQTLPKMRIFNILALGVTYVLLHTSYDASLTRTALDFGAGPFWQMNSFIFYMKVLVLTATAGVLLFSGAYWRRLKHEKFEYDILILLSMLGMFVLLSSTNFLGLYVGLELMSFPLYILCAFKRDAARGGESALKYFVLGSLASGVLLYGVSLLYGATGGFSFLHMAAAAEMGLMYQVGFVMVFVALVFKVSLMPFHIWTPDVYEGAPTPVTAFMATAPKVAAMGILIRLMMEAFGPMAIYWQDMLMVLAVMSFIGGSLLALVQNNIKRLLAFSSIGNVGFMAIGLLIATPEGIAGTVTYLTFYLLASLGVFAVILLLSRKGVYVDTLSDIRGLVKVQPVWAVVFLVLMLSLAGVPPLAGFFGKFYVFSAAIQAGYMALVITAVVASVIAAGYCLRVLKVVFFDDGHLQLDTNLSKGARLVAVVSAVSVLLLGVLPFYVADYTQSIVSVFFGG